MLATHNLANQGSFLRKSMSVPQQAWALHWQRERTLVKIHDNCHHLKLSRKYTRDAQTRCNGHPCHYITSHYVRYHCHEKQLRFHHNNHDYYCPTFFYQRPFHHHTRFSRTWRSDVTATRAGRVEAVRRRCSNMITSYFSSWKQSSPHLLGANLMSSTRFFMWLIFFTFRHFRQKQYS